MLLFRKNNWKAEIARTGFLTSASSWVVFWLLDLLRDGFVSRYFSVHIFLLAAILFAIWWSVSLKRYEDRPKIQLILALGFGILLTMIVWMNGETLGANRGFLAILTFLSPILFLGLLRAK